MTPAIHAALAPRTSSNRMPVVLTWINAAFAVARQRRQLKTLDDARLDDLGLTRDIARREARRPIWDMQACLRE